MQVALVRYRYSPHGGAERYLDALAAGLLEKGSAVKLLASSWEGEGARGIQLERISVFDRPKPLRVCLFSRAVMDWAMRNPDWLLFSLERVPGAEVYRAGDGCHAEWLLRKRVLRPGIWPVDSVRLLNRAYLFLEKRMFLSPKLRMVIANSFRGREEIVRHYGVSPERIAVIYNGVDTSRYPLDRRREAAQSLREMFGIPKNVPVYLFVGSGFTRKGVGCLVEASILLARKGVQFRVIVVGKGPQAPYLRKVRTTSVGDLLIFTGPVPDARIYFLGADAFVFPTLYEPFSNACLEAMAAGLPVITTKVNGASEILEEGSTGFLLEDPVDAPTLADRMEALLAPDVRREMGEKARNVAEGFPTERNARETLECLDRIWREKTGG